jgi:hypothetical protein
MIPNILPMPSSIAKHVTDKALHLLSRESLLLLPIKRYYKDFTDGAICRSYG